MHLEDETVLKAYSLKVFVNMYLYNVLKSVTTQSPQKVNYVKC